MTACRNGHDLDVLGRTRSGRCLACQRAYQRAYERRYTARHKGVRAEINARYRAKMPLLSVGFERREIEALAALVGHKNMRATVRRLVQEFLRQAKRGVA